MASTPKVLKDAEVYLDGNRFLSRAKTITLPGVATQTETFEALGTGGPVEIPMPGVTDDLELAVAFASHEASVYALLDAGRTQLIEALASVQRYDHATGEMVEAKHQATARVLFREHEAADEERGQADGPTFTGSCVYYAYAVAGVTVLEINKLGEVPTHKVLRDGALVDLMQQTNVNLGRV